MSNLSSHEQNDATASLHIATPLHLPGESHQFDFCLGDWDLTWEGGRGRNRVTRVFDEQVIQEEFSGFASSPDDKPLLGLSVSVYVPAIDAWRQTWIDSSGN